MLKIKLAKAVWILNFYTAFLPKTYLWGSEIYFSLNEILSETNLE